MDATDNKKIEITRIPVEDVNTFCGHPFMVKKDDELERLTESIAEMGILVPVLVRPIGDGAYEMVSGHRRMEACKALGYRTIPAIIRKMTDEEAVIAMVDANLQREHILPSEKAFAYKMKYEAIKKMTSASHVETHLRSDEILGTDLKESRSKVQRYIRLTNLIPEIMRMVDEERIAITPAVEISYLSEDEQKILLEMMQFTEATPSLSQAQRMHRISRDYGITEHEIRCIMEEEKGNQKEYVKIPVSDLKQFFKSGTSIRQMSETVSLQYMQDYGVNLICVEDGIDSSRDSGKLMISVLSAVAEIERENILIQTMEGRRQKAREGKWNGGFAPYGYELVNGELKIVPEEAEIIRIIFDKYVHTNMGTTALAKYLNQHGYEKKIRQFGTISAFSAHFLKTVIDNPVYCGKLAYGRRKTEKIVGERNQFHIVKQSEYPMYDGIHEGIVSEEVWQLAQKKRKENARSHEKVYSLEHEHILSGILVCPKCGGKLYGNVNRKKKNDGTLYKDHFYYACKHRLEVDGHKCDYHKQWTQDRINSAVEEVINKLINNPRFEAAIKEKIDAKINTSELDKELEGLQKKLFQLNGAKQKLSQQIDTLDVTDRYYDRKYQDMQNRLFVFYNEIDGVEDEIASVKERILNIQRQKINGDNVYCFLQFYGIMYQKFTDAEKKKFMQTFLEKVEIFEEPLPNGRLLKKIVFAFPVFYNGEECTEISWDENTAVETVCLLSNRKADSHIKLSLDMDEYYDIIEKEQAENK